MVEYIRKKSMVRVMAINNVSQKRKDLMERLNNFGKTQPIWQSDKLNKELNEPYKILLALKLASL